MYLCEFIYIKCKHLSISNRHTTYIRFFLANHVCVYVIFIYDKRKVFSQLQLGASHLQGRVVFYLFV